MDKNFGKPTLALTTKQYHSFPNDLVKGFDMTWKGLTDSRLLIQTVGKRVESALKLSINIMSPKNFVDVLEITVPVRIHKDIFFFLPLLCFGISIILRNCACVNRSSNNKSDWREMLASARTPTHQFPPGRAVTAATLSLSLLCHLLCHQTQRTRRNPPGLCREC